MLMIFSVRSVTDFTDRARVLMILRMFTISLKEEGSEVVLDGD